MLDYAVSFRKIEPQLGMLNRMRLQTIALCFYCLLVTPEAASAGVQPLKVEVVRSEAQLQSMLASGKVTPLDALTPYGKRRFLSTLAWRSKGVGGFAVVPLIRELSADELSAILSLLDSTSYFPFIREQLIGAPVRLPAPSPEVEQHLVALEEVASRADSGVRDFNTTRDGSALLQHYDELFGAWIKNSALHSQDTENLPLLFDAAALVARENSSTSAVEDMLEIYREMNARGIDTRRSFDSSILTAMIAARDFDQARKFASSRPHLAKRNIPAVVDSVGPNFKGRSVFHYDAGSDTLTRRPVPYADGIQLVMVVDSGCHFSRDALEAIRADTEFREKLQTVNLLLVTPPGSPISTGFLSSWNDANPSLPIYAPYNMKEWNAIAVTSVPQFFVLKNGVVMGQLSSGWPVGGNKTELINLINSISR